MGGGRSFLFPGVKQLGHEANGLPHLEPNLKMNTVVPLLPHMWTVQIDNLIPELPNTAYGCGQHGPVIAWFRSAWPDNVTPVPKTLGV